MSNNAIFAVIFLFICISNASADTWPLIKPATFKKTINSDASRVELKIFSTEKADTVLYTLMCDKNGTDKNGLAFYGMFQCMLLTHEKNSADLLEGDESWALKAGDTRGVFTFEQMIGPCKSDPKFGKHRFFEMRGMTLELEVKNFKSPDIADMLAEKTPPSFSFDFQVNLFINEKAATPYTSPKAEEYCNGYYEVDSKTGKAVYHAVGL